MPTSITTSTAATATAYSNQRKLDRTSNGVLWAMYTDNTVATDPDTGQKGGSCKFRYSLDNGATWSAVSHFVHSGVSNTHTPNASLFIDQDDFAHVAYKDASNGFIYYRRGTPNAGRTAWTWSAATQVDATANAASWDYPDLVAHREGSDWRVHIVATHPTNAGLRTQYGRLNVTAAGAVTVAQAFTTISTNTATAGASYPSIDFNHTGDGKTVAGGTPHLYVAWSHATTGAGQGIRFKKATYSAGSWTFGADQAIDTTRYLDSSAAYWLNCLFDGTRVVIAGYARTATLVVRVIYERDAADTTTTTRVFSSGSGNLDALSVGSATYDAAGNVYMLGNVNNASNDSGLYLLKFTRSGASFALTRQTARANGLPGPYISAKRGYSGSRVEWVYTDGAASPYTVTYDGIVDDSAPTQTHQMLL